MTNIILAQTNNTMYKHTWYIYVFVCKCNYLCVCVVERTLKKSFWVYFDDIPNILIYFLKYILTLKKRQALYPGFSTVC